MPSTVIRIENVWKQYRLGVIGHGSLARDLQSWWARRRGRQDPNAKIVAAAPPPCLDGQDRFWALQDVNLDIVRGEVLGIIGRNGAGKSTLLKILSRITAPTRGQVRIRGRIASLLEVGTGFHPELTGRENIFLNGAIMGMHRAEIQHKLDEIIAFAEIEGFHRHPGQTLFVGHVRSGSPLPWPPIWNRRSSSSTRCWPSVTSSSRRSAWEEWNGFPARAEP